MSAGQYTTEWNLRRYTLLTCSFHVCFEVRFLSAFAALQILSAAGYHVLSLDYRGKNLFWTLRVSSCIEVWYFPLLRLRRLHRRTQRSRAHRRRPLPVPVGKGTQKRWTRLSVGTLARHWVGSSPFQHVDAEGPNTPSYKRLKTSLFACRVATNTAVKLQEQGRSKIRSRMKVARVVLSVFRLFSFSGSIVDALILEAPFTRMRDVADIHVIAKVRSGYSGIKSEVVGGDMIPPLVWCNVVVI